jgi:hypothetical protein
MNDTFKEKNLTLTAMYKNKVLYLQKWPGRDADPSPPSSGEV